MSNKSEIESNLKRQMAEHRQAQVQRAGQKIQAVLEEFSCELAAVVEFGANGVKSNVIVRYKDG